MPGKACRGTLKTSAGTSPSAPALKPFMEHRRVLHRARSRAEKTSPHLRSPERDGMMLHTIGTEGTGYNPAGQRRETSTMWKTGSVLDLHFVSDLCHTGILS
jgi:hypothetical protein